MEQELLGGIQAMLGGPLTDAHPAVQIPAPRNRAGRRPKSTDVCRRLQAVGHA